MRMQQRNATKLAQAWPQTGPHQLLHSEEGVTAAVLGRSIAPRALLQSKQTLATESDTPSNAAREDAASGVRQKNTEEKNTA